MQIVTDDQAKTVTISDFDLALYKKAKIPATYTVILNPTVSTSLLQDVGRNISYVETTTYEVKRNGECGIVSNPVVKWVQVLGPVCAMN